MLPYVDLKDFKYLYPIYSIDLSNQPKRISDAKSNIVLNVAFNCNEYKFGFKIEACLTPITRDLLTSLVG